MKFKIGDKVKINGTYSDLAGEEEKYLKDIEWVVTDINAPLWPISATPTDKESQYFGMNGSFNENELDLIE